MLRMLSIEPDLALQILKKQEEFFIDAFLKHRWYNGNTKRDKDSLCQAWSAFVRNVKDIGREAWLRKLDTARAKFESDTNCIGCLVRQGYLASLGETLAPVVITNQSG